MNTTPTTTLSPDSSIEEVAAVLQTQAIDTSDKDAALAAVFAEIDKIDRTKVTAILGAFLVQTPTDEDPEGMQIQVFGFGHNHDAHEILQLLTKVVAAT